LNVEIKIDETAKPPRLVVYTSEVKPQISSLVHKLSGDTSTMIIGFEENEAFLLNKDEIFRFYTENQRIFARCEAKTYRVKNRLYELEETLVGSSFVRISNSEIANFDKVASLDMSISGTITLKFKNGDTAYVSRRYVEKIKQYLGL
jgi:DNA-binding LytR/AlgR family response regulator